MQTRFLGPAICLASATIAAGCYLHWVHVVGEWLPRELISGAYNSILFVVCVSFGLLLHRALGGNASKETDGDFALTAGGTVRVLGIVAASLVWINASDYLLKRVVDYPYRRIMKLYAFSTEQNVPTLFSAILLLSCALLLGLIKCLDTMGWQVIGGRCDSGRQATGLISSSGSVV